MRRALIPACGAVLACAQGGGDAVRESDLAESDVVDSVVAESILDTSLPEPDTDLVDACFPVDDPALRAGELGGVFGFRPDHALVSVGPASAWGTIPVTVAVWVDDEDTTCLRAAERLDLSCDVLASAGDPSSGWDRGRPASRRAAWVQAWVLHDPLRGGLVVDGLLTVRGCVDGERVDLFYDPVTLRLTPGAGSDVTVELRAGAGFDAAGEGSLDLLHGTVVATRCE